MGLIEELRDGPVALDTAIFIYFIEDDPAHRSRLEPVFSAIDLGKLPAVTSSLTLLEVLVVPYRANNIELAERYQRHLQFTRGLTLVGVDLDQLRLAARLRADFGVRTPDALQLAAGLSHGCSSFLTNDRRLPASIGGMRVVQLSDCAP